MTDRVEFEHRVEFELRAGARCKHEHSNDGCQPFGSNASSLAVDLVSVNPYVPKYFGPEKLTHAQFADNFLSIGIYRI